MKKERPKKGKPKNNTPQYRLDNMNLFLTDGYANKKCIEHFADTQLEYYIKNKKELQISAFRLTKGVNKNLYGQWRAKNKYLQSRHEFLLEMLAHRRQAVLFSHNPNLITYTQYQYDEDWADADERNDNRKLNIVKHQSAVPTHIAFPSWHDIETAEDAKKLFRKTNENDDS